MPAPEAIRIGRTATQPSGPCARRRSRTRGRGRSCRSIFSGELATGTASQRSPPASRRVGRLGGRPGGGDAGGGRQREDGDDEAKDGGTASHRTLHGGLRLPGGASARQGFKCASRGQPIGGGIPSLGCDPVGGGQRIDQRAPQPRARRRAPDQRHEQRGRGGPAAGAGSTTHRSVRVPSSTRASASAVPTRSKRDRPNVSIMRSGGLTALPGTAAPRRGLGGRSPARARPVRCCPRPSGRPGRPPDLADLGEPASASEAGSQPTLRPPSQGTASGVPLRAARPARHGQLTGPPHACPSVRPPIRPGHVHQPGRHQRRPAVAQHRSQRIALAASGDRAGPGRRRQPDVGRGGARVEGGVRQAVGRGPRRLDGHAQTGHGRCRLLARRPQLGGADQPGTPRAGRAVRDAVGRAARGVGIGPLPPLVEPEGGAISATAASSARSRLTPRRPVVDGHRRVDAVRRDRLHRVGGALAPSRPAAPGSPSARGDSTWSAPRSLVGGLPTPSRTRRNSALCRWSRSERRPLWPASPPPRLSRSAPDGQVELVVDDHQPLEVLDAVVADEQLHRPARVVHVGLGERRAPPGAPSRRTSSTSACSLRPTAGARRGGTPAARPPRRPRCAGSGRTPAPGCRAPRPAAASRSSPPARRPAPAPHELHRRRRSVVGALGAGLGSAAPSHAASPSRRLLALGRFLPTSSASGTAQDLGGDLDLDHARQQLGIGLGGDALRQLEVAHPQRAGLAAPPARRPRSRWAGRPAWRPPTGCGSRPARSAPSSPSSRPPMTTGTSRVTGWSGSTARKSMWVTSRRTGWRWIVPHDRQVLLAVHPQPDGRGDPALHQRAAQVGPGEGQRQRLHAQAVDDRGAPCPHDGAGWTPASRSSDRSRRSAPRAWSVTPRVLGGDARGDSLARCRAAPERRASPAGRLRRSALRLRLLPSKISLTEVSSKTARMALARIDATVSTSILSICFSGGSGSVSVITSLLDRRVLQPVDGGAGQHAVGDRGQHPHRARPRSAGRPRPPSCRRCRSCRR